jgi:hypothetical protein
VTRGCAGCATATSSPSGESAKPPPIESARVAYERAESGPASEVAPDELRSARDALEEAERAYRIAPHAATSRDLAYLAERKAELLEARVGITLARQRIDMARRLRTQRTTTTEGK